ncbi:hypothetical protein QNI16_17725 [Cytophagaceae bacterium YF14B1]|uniref:Uncharacterized protein n=1 Tax=Xanthocytophaga flava TaxID=3048013 RepID=A0AAE3QSB9_9BACT|nr:hypothetical protein [Xanthocytophaga flavus]MDJ1482350.1 hypothetical protein [Xanthocytophaga flavus]
MKTAPLLGVIGSLLLFVSTFMPILKVPLYGSINYFQNGLGYGVVIAAIAMTALVLAILKENLFQSATALSATIVIGYTYVNFQYAIDDLRSEMQVKLVSHPLPSLADSMIDGIKIEYGFGVMMIGVILLFVAGLVRD